MRRTRRNLPHFEDEGATYFIRFSLKNTVLINLADPAIAQIIIKALKHFANVRYLLYDYTVMPDHVHVILKPLRFDDSVEPLARIMQSIKGWTARQINLVLCRRGALWQDESYDHVIRDQDDYQEKARYIWGNPVAAGLVEDPQQWPWWGHGKG